MVSLERACKCSACGGLSPQLGHHKGVTLATWGSPLYSARLWRFSGNGLDSSAASVLHWALAGFLAKKAREVGGAFETKVRRDLLDRGIRTCQQVRGAAAAKSQLELERRHPGVGGKALAEKGVAHAERPG